MLKPKDITDQLSISAPTLRVWSNTFSPVLSPSAQRATTEQGTATQRRYTDLDLIYFRRAKELLDSGSTFEQTLEKLQTLDPNELLTSGGDQASEPALSRRQEGQEPSSAPALVTETHPIIQAFEEALRSKDEAIRALHIALESKDSEIQTLRGQVDELKTQPAPDPIVKEIPVRFRWSWLNKLLTAEPQSVG